MSERRTVQIVSASALLAAIALACRDPEPHREPVQQVVEQEPPDPLLATIEKVDETHLKIPRATLDSVLADPSAYARYAQAGVALRNGLPEGIQLYGIRAGSPLARLGFANGDTITAVNGIELTTPDNGLEVYASLKTATTLRLAVRRRLRPLTIDVQITK